MLVTLNASSNYVKSTILDPSPGGEPPGFYEYIPSATSQGYDANSSYQPPTDPLNLVFNFNLPGAKLYEFKGTVAQAGVQLAKRKLVAVSLARDSATGNRQVVGETQTISGGSFTLTTEYTKPCIVIAFDDQGKAWSQGVSLVEGDRIMPPNFSGALFQVVTAGDSGSVEPDWDQLLADGNGFIGTAAVNMTYYQQPQASGVLVPVLQETE